MTSRFDHQPLISIVMPFYNAQETIEAAVRSIISQSYTNWELLLLDDGSTDRSRKLVTASDDPRLIIWSDGTQRGLAPRLNECVSKARGQYIARMDSDDICYPDRLRAQVEFLQRNPNTDVVGCSVVVIGEDGSALGKRVVPETHEDISGNPAWGFHIVHPTWLARAEWFQQNHYDAAAIRYEDFELLFRTHWHSRFANLPEVLYGYREPRNGFKKRLKTRVGRLRYFYRNRDTHGAAMFLNTAKHESWKIAADAMIVMTGQRYATLKSRMLPLTTQEEDTWKQVLTATTNSDVLAAAR